MPIMTVLEYVAARANTAARRLKPCNKKVLPNNRPTATK